MGGNIRTYKQQDLLYMQCVCGGVPKYYVRNVERGHSVHRSVVEVFILRMEKITLSIVHHRHGVCFVVA